MGESACESVNTWVSQGGTGWINSAWMPSTITVRVSPRPTSWHPQNSHQNPLGMVWLVITQYKCLRAWNWLRFSLCFPDPEFMNEWMDKAVSFCGNLGDPWEPTWHLSENRVLCGTGLWPPFTQSKEYFPQHLVSCGLCQQGCQMLPVLPALGMGPCLGNIGLAWWDGSL